MLHRKGKKKKGRDRPFQRLPGSRGKREKEKESDFGQGGKSPDYALSEKGGKGTRWMYHFTRASELINYTNGKKKKKGRQEFLLRCEKSGRAVLFGPEEEGKKKRGEYCPAHLICETQKGEKENGEAPCIWNAGKRKLPCLNSLLEGKEEGEPPSH